MFAYNRVTTANYSIPTFDEWATNPDKRSDRFAQFCWFIASTAGNFAMRCAGSWFPFCAKCPDVAHELNSTYGMAPTQEESQLLVVKFRKLTRVACTRSVQLQRDHAGRELMQMPKREPVAPPAIPSVPSVHSSQQVGTKRTGSEIEYTGSDGQLIKSKRLQALYDESVHPMGGGPLHSIPEFSAQTPSWTSDRVTGRSRMDLDELLNAMQPAPVSTAPPSDFIQGRYRHAEFENEWYQLRRARSPDLPPEREEGFQRRGFSPVVPPNTPLSHLQGPLFGERIGRPLPPPNSPVPGPQQPYQLEQYVEDTFNYLPYLIFGGILIGLAVITDDPRGETRIAFET